MPKPKITVVIPVYNEQKTIINCLTSLGSQTYKPLEVIVIDDGSTDKTRGIIENLKLKIENLQLLRQKHLGPGPARNLGASKAKGKILVFVDADMTFDKNFIRDLTAPILAGQTIGTFSKNEMNANVDNIWSRCWQINRGWPIDRLIPPDYPDKAPIFRAILKREFDKVDGFDATGEYTDDWSLSRKLGIKSTKAPGAIYYHANPSTLWEVFKQARWIGKNEFISGDLPRRIKSLILYSLPISFLIGLYRSFLNFNFYFLIFKLCYDAAVWISVIKSFFGERKSK
ncbi:MAG: glycosyltransferase family 2 protein [Patescibacteria group bacterium]